MTRVEENKEQIENLLNKEEQLLSNPLAGAFEPAMVLKTTLITSLLIDISKSLAIQADAAVEANKLKKNMDGVPPLIIPDDPKGFNTLEQEPCEMTVEEYRQRMIQAFQKTNCDELIALCVLPTEKEFEHLEWLLKNHYKKEPDKAGSEEAITRKELIKSRVSVEEIKKAYENIMDVAEGRYVDIEEVKVHFCSLMSSIEDDPDC